MVTPTDEQEARILSQEVNYAYSSFVERFARVLKDHVITNLQSAIRNDPSNGNAALILATSVRETLEDEAVRSLTLDLEAFGIELDPLALRGRVVQPADCQVASSVTAR